jgi:hypothetical protein
MIKNDPLVLYTKDKTITDTAFIRAFHERNMIYSMFDTAGMATSPIHVSFNNSVADSVYLNGAGLDLVFNQVYYEGNTVVYIGRDSLRVPAAEDGELSCSNVGPRLRRHPLLTDCTPTGPLGEWISKARYQVPLMMDGNDIVIPIISYYFFNKTLASSCVIQEKYVLGQFDEDALKTIHMEDTLLVQRRTLVLEKK